MPTVPLILPNGKPTDDAALHARAHRMAREMDGDPIDEAPCYSCPGDRVVYADSWQGTLDTPSAEDLAWLAANPAPEPEWEPSPEDWRDYHEHCLEQERLDALRRMEDHEYELRMRFGE
jgi:hypothetical protein